MMAIDAEVNYGDIGVAFFFLFSREVASRIEIVRPKS
jgi:hypothetical protein